MKSTNDEHRPVTRHPRDQSARQHFRPNGPLLPSPRGSDVRPALCPNPKLRRHRFAGRSANVGWAPGPARARCVLGTVRRSASPGRNPYQALTRAGLHDRRRRERRRPTSPLCVTEPTAASADGARQAERCLSGLRTRRAASMLLRGAVPMLKRGKPGKHCVRSSAQIIGDSVEFPRHRNIRS
jgi:hypothetical protein